MSRPSPSKARKEPIPDGTGWPLLRHLANSRVPITLPRFMDLTGLEQSAACHMLEYAWTLGWFDYTPEIPTGYMGRL